MEKIGKGNQKVRKIGQIVNQTFAIGLEHDKNSSTMGFRYLVKEHVGKGMMVLTL
jgi:hypothetical protein